MIFGYSILEFLYFHSFLSKMLTSTLNCNLHSKWHSNSLKNRFLWPSPVDVSRSPKSRSVVICELKVTRNAMLDSWVQKTVTNVVMSTANWRYGPFIYFRELRTPECASDLCTARKNKNKGTLSLWEWRGAGFEVRFGYRAKDKTLMFSSTILK